jgi:glutamyl/glutaminyl-tRNA synthetase
MSPRDFFSKVKPWLEKLPSFPGDYETEETLVKMAALFRERIRTFDEIVPQIEWFFAPPENFEEKGIEKLRKISDWVAILKSLIEKLAQAEFSETALESLIRKHAEEHGKKAGDVIHICRLGLTGKTTTPGLFELMSILGKNRCLPRLKNFLAKFSG